MVGAAAAHSTAAVHSAVVAASAVAVHYVAAAHAADAVASANLSADETNLLVPQHVLCCSRQLMAASQHNGVALCCWAKLAEDL